METAIINEDQIIIDQKREAWGKMGVMVFKKELEFQASAQQSLAKLAVLPTTIEDVPKAEATLREVKAEQAKLVESRKAITSKFDAVAQRLMEPEKSFELPVSDFSKAIILVKKAYEQEEAKKKAKTDELNRIKQSLLMQVAGLDAEYKRLIAEKVNTAYTWALQNGTKPEESNDYCDRVCFRVTDSLFTPPRPNPARQYATIEEVNAIIEEVFKIKPSVYTKLFVDELGKRFSDYEVAYNNKQQALELAKKEQEQKLKEIQDQQQNSNIAAALETTATDLSVAPSGIKALKKAYEVQMDETFENAMKILSAFLANKDRCQPKTTVKKWFSFNADSAAKALAKVKSDDNAFAPVGINFIEVDKL